MKKSIIAIIIIALSATSCVGYDIKNKTQKQEVQITKNPLQLKDVLIYLFDTSQLDIITKSCYTTEHYYDKEQKFTNYINNNGNFGGNIFSIDGQNKNCAMLPYTNINNIFNRISTTQSVIEDCADFRYCELNSMGFNDKNELLGLVNPYVTYSYINNSFVIQKFKDRLNLINLIDTTDFNAIVYNFDFKKNLLTNLSNGKSQDISIYDELVGFNSRYINNIIYGKNGYVKLNDSTFYQLTQQFESLSRNGEIFAQIKSETIDLYDSINNNYYQLSIPSSIGKISSYSPRYLISDDKILRINTWYNGKSTEFLINIATGNWYKLEDLFANLNLSQYKSLKYQISPNGQYMLIDGTYDTTNILAVKVFFSNGIANYLQNNLQPLQ